MRNILIPLIALFFSSHYAFAQPDVEFAGLLLNNPGENLLTLRNSQLITIDLVNGKPFILCDTYLERMYLNNRAGLYSEFSIEYSDLNKVKHIEAATLVPGKRDYKQLDVKNFKDEELISDNVFYDGSHTITFSYSQLVPGTKTVLKYTEECSEPRLLSSFFFQSYSNTSEANCTVVADKDVELGWKMFNAVDSTYEFDKKSDKNGRITYSWKMHSLPKYESDDQAPNMRYSIPHVVFWIKSFKSAGRKIPVLSEVADLYNWVYSISRDVNKADYPALHHIVDSLVAGIIDEEAKVKKLFYWTQDNIRYIAFEDGMGGFVPRSAYQVLEKRFGDCKDMASLLNTLLRYAGIKSYLTWIGSRELPYSYMEVPTPVVDNHMIVTYIKDGKYYFLDATGENVPFSMPTWYIQGKEALIGIDSTLFEVKVVPVAEAAYNLVVDSVFIVIEGSTFKGNGHCVFKGYSDQGMSDNIMEDPHDVKKLFRQVLTKGNNKFLLDSVSVNDFHDRDKDLIVDYVFNVEDYVRISGDELFINLNLEKYWMNEGIEKERKLSIQNKFKSNVSNIVSLEIPSGYKIDFIPKDVQGGNDNFNYNIHYKVKDNRLILESTYSSELLLMLPSDFESWNKMIHELKGIYSEVVILKKI